MSAEKLITDHIDIWTSAIQAKSASGRGSSKKRELYGIKKLRELILELAVRGKLVPQDPTDEPANNILARSIAIKESLLTEGKIKKSRAKKDIKEEHFYDYPASWATAKIEDLIQVINGRAYKKSEMLSSGIPILRVGNLFTSNEWYYSDLDLDADKYIDRGDLIYAWSASFGPFIWEGSRVIYHYHIWKMDIFHDGALDKNFSKLFLQAISERIKASGNGIAMIHMTKERMEKVVHPLPPIEEQRRIVAKVDELMTLCDQLEQQTEASLDAHQVLVETLLATLTNSQDATELMANWGRISEHFDTLFTTEQSIDQLKQTILQLAVMGKLVPFGSNTEKGGLKKFLSFGPRNGYSPKEVKSDTGVKVLKLGATSYGSLDLNESKSVDVDIERDSHLWLNKGDILIQRGNSANYVGCNCLVEEDVSGVIYPDLMMKIRPSDITSSEFLSMWLSSPMAREFMWSRMTGTSGTMPKISKKVVESIPIVMPSRQTQDSIVAKAQDLLSICEHLKQRIRDIQQTQLQLTDTIVEQAL
ncbi:TPA: restriction endonuclease subunit S [Vibrio vulnificus]|uniref:restriction endonuclease subunit S n=1 Tax=Vibrio vulnificus TaxID=672 RepID=UPI0019D4D7F6|nr:restriction endonuclease subunit S [Vibrio vulnificus]MBN8090393.1 restriction endonuclease subunit S [Vibrio vulnificus]MBN8119252.1 restriction endonuclease subunit S [Vibrio vulnificus]